MSDNLLFQAIDHMESLPNSDKVNIKGKLYAQVTTRVVAFRKAYGDKGRITTKIHTSNENRILIEAQIHVRDGNVWHLIANDWAEEFRNDGPINKKSATENCATSAIGRALAALGLGGGEYASFDEVDYAIKEKQGVSTEPKKKAVKPDVAPVKAKPEKQKVEDFNVDEEDYFKVNTDVLIDELAGCKDLDEAKEKIKKYYPSIKSQYSGHKDFADFQKSIDTRLAQLKNNTETQQTEEAPF